MPHEHEGTKYVETDQILFKLNRNRHVVAQVLIVIFVILVVIAGSIITSIRTSPTATNTNPQSAVVLDELTAAEIAANVADNTNSMVGASVINHAENIGNKEETYNSSEDFIGKPATQTDTSARQSTVIHTVKKGEALEQIATLYGLRLSTIKWANDLPGNTIKSGQKLQIPPVDGISYTVRKGDTPESIARKFGSSASRIINLNDTEISGLKPGLKIIVPDGKPQQNNSFGSGTNTAVGLQNPGNGFGSSGEGCEPNQVQSVGRVSQGEVIGLMGSTGSSTGKHLHFGVCEDGNYIDPISSRKDRTLISGFSWPVRNRKADVSRWFDCTRFWAANKGNCPAGWYFHAGVDITEPWSKKTEILAIGDGEIIYRGYQFGSGYTVIIRHDNGLLSQYRHMMPF